MDITNYNSIVGVLKSKEEINKIQNLVNWERKYSQKPICFKVGDKIWVIFGSKKYDNFNDREKELASFLHEHSSGVKKEYPDKNPTYFVEAYVIKVNDVVVYDHYVERKKMETKTKKLAKRLICRYLPKEQQKSFRSEAEFVFQSMQEKQGLFFVDSLVNLLREVVFEKSTVIRPS